METRKEKRSERRRAFNDLISFDRVLKKSSRLRNIQQNGVGLNISRNGLGLAADFPAKKGEVLRVLLPVKKAGTHLPVFAEVMWSERSNGNYRMGLRFLK